MRTSSGRWQQRGGQVPEFSKNRTLRQIITRGPALCRTNIKAPEANSVP
ncbi:hypothetical protein SBD_0225 [Streptomyces bottropensis ATCC 25435]|uniref:Uncharacterized protein n=1 Tax=Streptomyces bottropensis ATCC 25435 TaxID=1054862 RepID=M3F7D6_9ACTN|nr:hypothetical protein SBD_0225 [Streptomyces bottropensis ATCC 25435]